MDYPDFFKRATGSPPFPYQRRLGEAAWPELLDIPTGLGKTAAVCVAWLWKRSQGDLNTGRRLVYCLPTRVLVKQTADVAAKWATASKSSARVHLLLGGEEATGWDADPDKDAILVGTQDMLLSRALNRGYAMSRYRWPMAFSLLHNDCLWVLDETQLMGVGIETSAQLEGLRAQFETFAPAHTMWMSATLNAGALNTVDHPEPEGGRRPEKLEADDHDHSTVAKRLGARKPIARGSLGELPDTHRGGLTLVVLNRVPRAQELYSRLNKAADCPVALVHSRFRPLDRAAHEGWLNAQEDRIVVATQAIEAGVDISARVLFTELAPWSSLVQRFGRCNRYGEWDEKAVVKWIDVADDDKDALPYTVKALQRSRALLAEVDDVGPGTLAGIEHTEPPVVRPVLRRRDLVDLFDTTPDLLGFDLDISRFVRDEQDTDVRFAWRELSGKPDEKAPRPQRDELCSVPIGTAAKFLKKLDKGLSWEWDALDSEWKRVDRPHPGRVYLLDVKAGGYTNELGWTGNRKHRPEPVPLASDSPPAREMGFGGNRSTQGGRWVKLTTHVEDVGTAVGGLARAVNLPAKSIAALELSAAWHDVGKAHEVFQAMLDGPDGGPWAKSDGCGGNTIERRYFRHELASALALLAHGGGDLAAYLVAAHHGKVRLSIRSVPGEEPPPGRDVPFARGIWHGDELPAVDVPGEGRVGPFTLDLSLMQLGEGSWLERTLKLREGWGPFRLAYLETILRAADWRASAAENTDKTGTDGDVS